MTSQETLGQCKQLAICNRFKASINTDHKSYSSL